MTESMNKALSVANKFNSASGFKVTSLKNCSENVVLLKVDIDLPWKQDRNDKIDTITLKFVNGELHLSIYELPIQTLTHILEVLK